jgi:hypothetical protein
MVLVEIVVADLVSAIVCRICFTAVKKGGVLCQHCGLICHTSCATKAPIRCDITEQQALLARKHDILALSSSATSSRRPSFNDHPHDHKNVPFNGLPHKLLNGWKRSKSVLNELHPDERRKRRSSGNLGPTISSSPGYRHSMEIQPGDESRRASVFTTSDVGEDDMRRRSGIGIRFELDEMPVTGGPGEEEKMVGVEVVSRPMSPVSGTRKGHLGYVRGKDSKSECSIM